VSGRSLGIGIIGSGFNAGFHLQAFTAVRDAEVLGVWSPNAGNAAAAAALARRLDVGDARPFARSRRWSGTPGSTPSGSAAPTTPASRT
jgi:ornithine cyclodeaminase/alanine dehydrogenase-like protein (mu-crystallin family)